MSFKASASLESIPSTQSQDELLKGCARQLVIGDFGILKLLGTGRTGKVFLARHRETEQLLALKVIPKDSLSPKDFSSALREQRILKTLATAANGRLLFVRVLASWHDTENFYLAMEYLAGGDLAIELGRCKVFDEERVKAYAAEIITALEALHTRSIVHRDIKPANLLFRPDGHIVLADFGHSLAFSTHPDLAQPNNTQPRSSCDSTYKPCTTTEVCGTPFYMSPEMHAGRQYSYDVDLWALGVVMYRMLTRRMPLGGDATRSEIADHVQHDPVLFKPEDAASEQVRELLQKMLSKEPRSRPDLLSLKQDPFFDSIDWDEIKARRNVPAWTPFIPPVPKTTKTTLDFRQGEPYDACDDPYPDFAFISPSFATADELARADVLPSSPHSPPRSLSRLRKAVRRIFHCSRMARPAAPPLIVQLPSKEDDKLSLEESMEFLIAL
ncbi:kinase-like protein [Schizophyllum commune H4-8]|uniref:non-specific serine/threonine protein kinase n=1 Tax=Schizophyllum commune (strain H4-8 / FGSC 9210) TaxID=578458 RepID=D8Q912_SCHCM|nr:kinase-like protein [Schizophyllum commune H4-8]KAI5890590.1 kinase-like protein [Schizophyllum commune H4-8]